MIFGTLTISQMLLYSFLDVLLGKIGIWSCLTQLDRIPSALFSLFSIFWCVNSLCWIYLCWWSSSNL